MASNGDDRPEVKSQERLVRSAALMFAVVIVLCGAISLGFTVWTVAVEHVRWEAFLQNHFAAIIGLPCAGGMSFALVVFLRQADGPIEFKGLGFEFKGAAGQVVMWVLCFLAIAGAIKMCWGLS